jgi:hypothetical protein
MRQNLLVLGQIGHRTHPGRRVLRVAQLDRRRTRDDPVDQRFGDGFVNQQPRAGQAGLARRGEHSSNHAVGRGVKIAVVEYHLCLLAAQLQTEAS